MIRELHNVVCAKIFSKGIRIFEMSDKPSYDMVLYSDNTSTFFSYEKEKNIAVLAIHTKQILRIFKLDTWKYICTIKLSYISPLEITFSEDYVYVLYQDEKRILK